MAIRDVFRRSRPSPGRQPAAEADPGSVSSPLDVEGQGPVTLPDRTAPGGQASPDTNQGKAEPMPATPGEADPAAALPAPELDTMNVGGADPQAPSHPAARDRDGDGITGGSLYTGPVHPGVAPMDDRPALDPGSSTKLPEGSERPVQASEGVAQRAPGSLGTSPEEQETDTAAGAAAMRPGAAPHVQPGDSQGVSVPHELPAPGTSQEQGIVQGARTAVPPGQ